MEKMAFQPWNKYEEDLEIYTRRFLEGKLKELCHSKVMDLQVSYAYSDEPVAFQQIGSLKFEPLPIGGVWARKNFACAWFHLTGKLPEGISTQELYLEFSNDGEALLVDKDGSSCKGFTAGSPVFGVVDRTVEKRYFDLSGYIAEDGSIDLYIDGASNSLLGEYDRDCSKLEVASIVRRNPEMMEIYWNFDVLMDFVAAVNADHPHKFTVLNGLRSVRNLIVYNDPDMVKKAKEIFRGLYALPGNDGLQVTAVGHAHLDLAWLWPIRESKRKAMRTFSNFVYLLEKYPQFHAVVPQPQQLAWVKELDPKLYQRLKDFEREGRLEIIGGGWVENDTNVPCDESLVRQELYGQKFWLEEFGHYVRTRWLPDTFGYSAAIPQILRQSNQDGFMTIKISWSNRTKFPYNTFRWAGIDGSQVTVHMPPEGNYNSVAGPKALFRGKKGIKKTDPQDRMMAVYGIGDGGGGPSENIVQRVIRTENVPYLPKVKMSSAQGYFDELKDLELPLYQGEMYLEKHRGTYTSQSNNKNYNRTFEEKMLMLEKYLSARGLYGDSRKMDEMWKEALLYQFHDILPGSSIARVYEETDVAYARILAELEKLALAQGVSFLPGGEKRLLNLEGECVCKLVKAEEGYLLYQGEDLEIAPTVYQAAQLAAVPDRIVTDHYTVEMDQDGAFKRILLNENGFVAVENGNKLRVFMDTMDAWDFEDDYRDQPEVYMTLEESCIRDFGELKEICQHYRFQNSTLEQTILIHKHLPIIQIYHRIDWQDNGYMLRAEFTPGAWSEVVHSDIQFGYLDRPTTDRDAHEKAQFEVCCQKWMDISDDHNGFAILNNAKNGFMAKQGILSVDLLRSTDYPCVTGDMGVSCYSYALYPHLGGFDPVAVDTLAQQFGASYLYGEEGAQMPSFDAPQVQVTAFKPAYDGNGFILRAFERTGKTARAKLQIPAGFRLEGETNLLEDGIAPVSGDMTFKPFQIRTFRLAKQ